MKDRTIDTVTLRKHRVSVGVITLAHYGPRVSLTMNGPDARVSISCADTSSVRDFARGMRDELAWFRPRQRRNVARLCDALDQAAKSVDAARKRDA